MSAPSSLSDKQSSLLRRLVHGAAPSHAADLDGRVLGALERQGFVERAGEEVTVTSRGADYYNTHLRRRRRVPTRVHGSEEGRAEAIAQALAILEQALPLDRVLEVGDLRVSGADVIAGLRSFADVLGRTPPAPS